MTFLSSKHDLFLAAVTAGFFVLAFTSEHRCVRVHAPGDVEIAYWSWRDQMASEEQVGKAFRAGGAKVLFQRAGQFDITGGETVRIRPAAGRFPRCTDTHLVYNATRELLRRFETLDRDQFAQRISETYNTDRLRAVADGASVSGVQLDLDIPTRLLPEYTELLARLRQKLGTGTSLSITGLPTWSTSPDIREVLATVDFWIPQFYGSKIPERFDDHTPISSAGDVKRSVVSTRKLGKPFYAGLPSYGYAVLYDKGGSLIEVRGDIDPGDAAYRDDLELVDRQNYSDDRSGESRYVYRAREDVVLDDLIMNKGEMLVLDVPSAESLRMSARAVREEAGESLKGICIFRLPDADDRSDMTLEEIESALADVPTSAATGIELRSNKKNELELTAVNIGTARSLIAPFAVTIDLAVSPGSVTKVDLAGRFGSVETLCGTFLSSLRSCSPKRANTVRLGITSWRPGDRASATVSLTALPQQTLSALVTTQTNDGRTIREPFQLRNETDAK